ncbi:hypothetical protein Bbelb_091920 [Branchiostoma belcheri]|nr:hypothetical protein Bbelb_091920 [Branchiostoma belcheri]
MKTFKTQHCQEWSNVLSENSSLAGPLPELVVVSRPTSVLATGTAAQTGTGQPDLSEVEEGHLSESSQPEDKRVSSLLNSSRLRSVSESDPDSSYHFPERLEGSDPRVTPGLRTPDNDPDVFASTETHLVKRNNTEDQPVPNDGASAGTRDRKDLKCHKPDFLLDILQTRRQTDDVAKKFLRDLARGMQQQQQETVGCFDVFWQRELQISGQTISDFTTVCEECQVTTVCPAIAKAGEDSQT